MKTHDSAVETYGEGERAPRKLGIEGRSKMSKRELARAVGKAQ